MVIILSLFFFLSDDGVRPWGKSSEEVPRNPKGLRFEGQKASRYEAWGGNTIKP